MDTFDLEFISLCPDDKGHTLELKRPRGSYSLDTRHTSECLGRVPLDIREVAPTVLHTNLRDPVHPCRTIKYTLVLQLHSYHYRDTQH